MQLITINDDTYPQKLLSIHNPPPKLYIEGNEKLLNNTSVAIVCSRKFTKYGEKYTKEFASVLSANNICIVSGLALGIDSIAHQNSMRNIGKTIAVIGSGFNNIYPPENANLVKQILENDGCIISEYSPDMPIDMSNFPKRNRIIVGLSNGIFVVEAAQRSGSTLTGNLALKENKKVFCLPRNIEEIKGVGTNMLIQKGAKLVLNPNDILEDFGIEPLYFEYTESITTTPLFIPDEYKKIYNFLSSTPININALSKKTCLSINELTSKLTMMEIEGYIKSLPCNEYVRL